MACGPKRDSAARARGSRSVSSWSPARTREEDGPDVRDPPGGETGRGKGRWAGTGKRPAGSEGWDAGWAETKKETGRGNEKKKGRMGWAERVRGEKEKIFHFPKRFKHFQFKFKLKDLNLR